MAEDGNVAGRGGEAPTRAATPAPSGGIRTGTFIRAASVFVAVNIMLRLLEFRHLIELSPAAAAVIGFLLAVIELLVELCLRIDKLGHEVRSTGERLTMRLDGLEQSVAAKIEWRATVLQTLLSLAEKLPTEGDRRPFIERFLVNQGHLLASTDPLVRSLHAALLGYFDHWLRVDVRAGEVEKIRLHATQLQTYPIYRAIIPVTRNCEILRAINQVDLAWWVSPDGIQYIADNLAAVNENRVKKIERIFVFRNEGWNSEKLTLIKQINADFAAGIRARKVSLYAVFYERIAHLPEADLDAVVFKDQAALNWERPNVAGADPIIIVSFRKEDVKSVEAKIEAVSRNSSVQSLDDFIRQQGAELRAGEQRTPPQENAPQSSSASQPSRPVVESGGEPEGK